MEAVKTRTMSVCGVQCDACEHYPDICLGCKALEGKPYWLQYVEDRDVCDIYECCKKSKKLMCCIYDHMLAYPAKRGMLNTILNLAKRHSA